MKLSKRDGDYYLDLLKRKHSAVWADYQKGVFPSINAALRAAGVKKARTPLHELKNAWRKASNHERKSFVNWIKLGGAANTGMDVAVGQKLTPKAAKCIRKIMTKRHLKIGDVMTEVGFNRLDGSLGQALSSGTRLQPALINALEQWIERNRSV